MFDDWKGLNKETDMATVQGLQQVSGEEKQKIGACFVSDDPFIRDTLFVLRK